MTRLPPIAILLLACIALSARAQDAAQTLEELTAYYRQLDRYALDVEVRVTTPSEAPQVFRARTARLNAVVVQEFAGLEFLIHPQARLLIDKRSRVIQVGMGRGAADQAAPFPASVDPVPAITAAQRVGHSIRTDRSAATLTVTMEGGPGNERVELAFEQPSPRLTRMTIERPTSTITAVYVWQALSTWPSERFDIGHYIEPHGSAWRAAPSYRDYRVVLSDGQQ